MALVLLDRQHGDRRDGRPFDPGATSGPLRETDLCDAYGRAAHEALVARGHRVVWIDSGPYNERHRGAVWAARDAAGPVAYLALHANAGHGTYALVEHDGRSVRGARLARTLADAFAGLPGVTKAVTKALAPGERGFVCVSGIYAGPANLSAALVEPGFIDSAAHADLWMPEGLRRIGLAIADAVEAWAVARAA